MFEGRVGFSRERPATLEAIAHAQKRADATRKPWAVYHRDGITFACKWSADDPQDGLTQRQFPITTEEN